jgi:hypothetical protein
MPANFLKHQTPQVVRGLYLYCRSGGDRTLDPMIKSHVLYQLSYGPFV